MPEMPEVETIRKTLAPHIEGRKITKVDLRLDRLVKVPADPANFVSRLEGRTVTRLSRRGKYLCFQLDGAGDIFIVHLRMTGQLYYSEDGSTDRKYTRLALSLDNCSALLFADLRTLGALYLVSPEEIPLIKGLHTLGPEPLTEAFTEEYLTEYLSTRQTKIKSLLLDQCAIAGLGNIYADEALFLSGIHPERKAKTLTEKEIHKLYKAVNKVIGDGIADGGTTFSDYRDAHGESGHHQENLYAYQRTGKPCKGCGTAIQRLVIGGRSSHFCPNCQR